jgi:hypothetical protein
MKNTYKAAQKVKSGICIRFHEKHVQSLKKLIYTKFFSNLDVYFNINTYITSILILKC